MPRNKTLEAKRLKDELYIAGGATAGGLAGSWAAARLGARFGLSFGPLGVFVGSAVGAIAGAALVRLMLERTERALDPEMAEAEEE